MQSVASGPSQVTYSRTVLPARFRTFTEEYVRPAMVLATAQSALERYWQYWYAAGGGVHRTMGMPAKQRFSVRAKEVKQAVYTTFKDFWGNTGFFKKFADVVRHAVSVGNTACSNSERSGRLYHVTPTCCPSACSDQRTWANPQLGCIKAQSASCAKWRLEMEEFRRWLQSQAPMQEVGLLSHLPTSWGGGSSVELTLAGGYDEHGRVLNRCITSKQAEWCFSPAVYPTCSFECSTRGQ